MTSLLRGAALVLACGLMSACLQTVKSDVTRLSELTPADAAAGRTIYILPLEEQEGSLEFRTHARALGVRLRGLGFRQVDRFENADLIVSLVYGVSGAREVSRSTPIYGQTGGGTSYVTAYGGGATYGGTVYTPPTFGVLGYSTRTETHHDRYLDVAIFDRRRSTEEEAYAVYEAQVFSSGTDASFAAVSDCMMDALFRDFFAAGSTKVETPADKCVK